MLKILLVILLSHESSSLNPDSVLYNEVFIYHNDTNFKATYAYEVVSQIYGSFRQWFFTIIFCDFTYFENRILKYTENMNDGYPVLLLNSCPSTDPENVKPKLNKHGQTAYVVTSEVLSLDINDYVIRALKKTGVFKPRSAVIFVISAPVTIDSYFYYAMKKHFQLLHSRKITNSVLVVWYDKLKMYTYNPFSDNVLDITDIKDVNQFLAAQYNDLFGKQLRLSVFRKIFLTDKKSPVKCDSMLAQTVMKYLNATCLPLIPRDGSTVGDLLANGTATGVTGDLIEGYTDLELSSRILKNTYYGYIDTTYPLMQDEMCFLIKKETRQSTFMTTLKLISSNLLVLFFFVVVFSMTMALLARKAEIRLLNIKNNVDDSTTVMNLIKCFLRQTVDITFLGPAYRFIVLIIIIYSLIVDCAIDGIITSAITYPRYKPDIDSYQDLITNTNVTFAVHNRHMDMFIKSLGDDYELLKNRLITINDKKIKAIIDKRQFEYATLLRNVDAKYISRKVSNMKNGRPLFHVARKCPLPCFIVYGLQYGSPYLSRITHLLHHLNQGGIIQHWSESDEFTLYKSASNALYVADTKERKSLNLNNLAEVFYVWMFGIAISTVVFTCEVCYKLVQNLYII